MKIIRRVQPVLTGGRAWESLGGCSHCSWIGAGSRPVRPHQESPEPSGCSSWDRPRAGPAPGAHVSALCFPPLFLSGGSRSTMPALPLDQLQITHKDPKTGKLRTSPALVSRCLEAFWTDVIFLAVSKVRSESLLCLSQEGPRGHSRELSSWDTSRSFQAQ